MRHEDENGKMTYYKNETDYMTKACCKSEMRHDHKNFSTGILCTRVKKNRIRVIYRQNEIENQIDCCVVDKLNEKNQMRRHHS